MKQRERDGRAEARGIIWDKHDGGSRGTGNDGGDVRCGEGGRSYLAFSTGSSFTTSRAALPGIERRLLPVEKSADFLPHAAACCVSPVAAW